MYPFLYESIETEIWYPNINDLYEWFDEFNKEYFNNELPSVLLDIKDCGLNTLGVFNFVRSCDNRRKWTEPADPKSCNICISNLYRFTIFDVKDTLLHEMIHLWIYFNYNYDPGRIHGNEFRGKATEIINKSNWIIMPFNHEQLELSEYGLKKYKSRITDEYIIITYYDNKNNLYKCFRTAEKYITEISNKIKRFNLDCKWYKISVENPIFGVQSHISTGIGPFYFIGAGNTEEKMFSCIDKYGIINKYEFTPTIKNDYQLYIVVLYENKKSTYWITKIDDLKVAKQLKEHYQKHKIEVYKVNHYNEEFEIARKSIGVKFRSLFSCNDYDLVTYQLKRAYDINLENCERIRKIN